MIERFKSIVLRGLCVALFAGAGTLTGGCEEEMKKIAQAPAAVESQSEQTGWNWSGDPDYGPNPEYLL